VRSRTTAFVPIVLLVTLTFAVLGVGVTGCAPRPPSWPPDTQKLVESAPWYLDAERFQRSAHGSLTCEECHPGITTDDPAQPHPDPTQLSEAATTLYDYQACEACHPQAYAAYRVGVHAEAMANPDSIATGEPAPTCGDCHDAHYVTSQSRTELLASVNATCSTCHTEALETYQQNYHGKAALLGYQNSATCTDCHGAHTMLALYEPEESLPACQRCHPDANTRFAGYQIHPLETLNPPADDPRARQAPILLGVKIFFTVLVVAVLAFFYAHTGLWFLRNMHEKLRSPKGESRGGHDGHAS
jgi:predicted CXXCH cytochrome family protein